MPPCERVDVLAVAAANYSGDRDVTRPEKRKHPPVALLQALVGQGQPAKPVSLVRIDARIEEHQIRRNLSMVCGSSQSSVSR
jgi:hypothetical protein